MDKVSVAYIGFHTFVWEKDNLCSLLQGTRKTVCSASSIYFVWSDLNVDVVTHKHINEIREEGPRNKTGAVFASPSSHEDGARLK